MLSALWARKNDFPIFPRDTKGLIEIVLRFRAVQSSTIITKGYHGGNYFIALQGEHNDVMMIKQKLEGWALPPKSEPLSSPRFRLPPWGSTWDFERAAQFSDSHANQGRRAVIRSTCSLFTSSRARVSGQILHRRCGPIAFEPRAASTATAEYAGAA